MSHFSRWADPPPPPVTGQVYVPRSSHVPLQCLSRQMGPVCLFTLLFTLLGGASLGVLPTRPQGCHDFLALVPLLVD